MDTGALVERVSRLSLQVGRWIRPKSILGILGTSDQPSFRRGWSARPKAAPGAEPPSSESAGRPARCAREGRISCTPQLRTTPYPAPVRTEGETPSRPLQTFALSPCPLAGTRVSHPVSVSRAWRVASLSLEAFG